MQGLGNKTVSPFLNEDTAASEEFTKVLSRVSVDVGEILDGEVAEIVSKIFE